MLHKKKIIGDATQKILKRRYTKNVNMNVQ